MSTSWCPRCGDAGQWVNKNLPDPSCWDHRADAELVERFVVAVRERHDQWQSARVMLAEIGDHRALPALRRNVGDDDGYVRCAAIQSLGWSGERTDGALLAELAADPDLDMRHAARASLTELEVDEAVPVLLGQLDAVDNDKERFQILDCLAWLRDDHALGRLRELAPELLFGSAPWGQHTLAWALARLGTQADRDFLRDSIVTLLRAASDGPPRAQNDAFSYFLMFQGAVGAGSAEVAQARELADYWRGRWPELRHDYIPGQPRTVPKRAMASQLLANAPAGAGWPPAKFGGQPDWLEDPQWPLGEDGEPLTFYGQLPAPGPVARTAYIFLGGYESEDWEPLGAGNSVVTQPGKPGHLPTDARATGPHLYEYVQEPARYRRRRRSAPMQRFIVLADGADPEDYEWDGSDDDGGIPHNDMNKIGGTPSWVQGEEWPEGDGWSLAFQFDSEWAGAPRADVATCYGFIKHDGTAAFAWQRG